MIKRTIEVVIFLLLAQVASAQTSPPTTRPSSESAGPLKSLSADQVLDQMLQPTTKPTRLLEPVPDKPMRDAGSGEGSVKPNAPTANLRREGTFVIDSLARLTHPRDGRAELMFESDGKALQDPPMVILPNLKLMQMEDATTAANRDLKFRVTGMVTEYRGRNYIMLEKAVVVPDVTQQF
jgi:hypothetical protein